MIDRDVFFANMRNAPFGKVLTQQNVDGLNYILDMWNKNYASMDIRYLAYMLATVFEETDGTMFWGIDEKGGNAYFTKHYEGRSDLGNTQKGDGVKFHGRGPSQLTGRRNYTLFGQLLGIDLVGNPELAKKPEYAYQILFLGMIKGLFTGKKLGDFFKLPDYSREYLQKEAYNARTVVNGHKAANIIAGYFFNMLGALQAASTVNVAVDITANKDIPNAIVSNKPVDTVQPVTPVLTKDEVNVPAEPADTGKSLVQSITLWGTALATVAGSVGPVVGQMNNIYAVAGVLILVVAGFGIAIYGRTRIRYLAGY